MWNPGLYLERMQCMRTVRGGAQKWDGGAVKPLSPLMRTSPDPKEGLDRLRTPLTGMLCAL